jgi:hypothetical protein
MTSRLDQVRAVAHRELRREQTYRRQMQVSVPHGLENLWMTPRRARRLNPLVGHALRKAKHPNTVREHRRASLVEVEPASIDLAEMHEQFRLEGVAALDQLAYAREQLVAGNPSKRLRHDSTSRDRGMKSTQNITWGPNASWSALCSPIFHAIRDLRATYEKYSQKANQSV